MSALVLAVEKPFWQDVLIEAARLGADIGHAAVHYRRDTPQPFFDGHKVKLVDGKQFYRLDDLAQLMREHFASGHIALDKKIVDYFAAVERDFYILTDRYCYFPVSFRKRKRVFREGLKFWLTYFRDNDVTQVFTTCSPHSFADFTAYHVAKYLDVPVLQLAHTMINDRVILRHDYREDEKVPEDFLAEKSAEEIKKQIRPEILEAGLAQSNILKFVTEKNNVSQKVVAVERQRIVVLKKTLRRMRDNFGKDATFKGGIAMNEMHGKTLRRIARRHDFKWRGQQQKYYESKVTDVDLNDKYIYFSMHLQPERTSTPEAGVFEDHLMAIQILAKSLPSGWKLFIKENPRQFDKITAMKSVHHRNSTDYDDILRLPNVQLVSQKTSSAELVKHAQIVSTLSGSVGWEALQANKPVIIFGYSWYQACRACFKVSSINECNRAITEAMTLTAENIQLDILKYLAFMQNRFVIGNLGDVGYIKSIKEPYEIHVKSMAENIISQLNL